MIAIGGFIDPSADGEDLYDAIIDSLAKKYGP